MILGCDGAGVVVSSVGGGFSMNESQVMSFSSSGARCLTSSVARRTLSLCGLRTEPKLLKLSIATRGSMPKAAAVAAELTAMSASCSAVGSGFTAQSAYTSTRSFMHMRNDELTTLTPGRVLMNSRLGRMVFAVVLTAPDTMPSAMPKCTIIVPK